MMRACFMILASFLMLAAPALALDAPRAEFTKIQNLNPNTTSENRPIKQKWAVSIGISKYRDGRLNNNMPNDKAARDFYKYLVDPAAGRFATDHVRLLTNESAGLQNIMYTLGPHWLGSLADKDDLVVVFISTNAIPTTDGGTYLCAYNAALDNLYSTCLSMKDLMQYLKSNVKAERVVLVLQSCFSGSAELANENGSKLAALAGAKSLFKSYNVDVENLMLGKGYMILSSSKPDQLTFGDAFSANLIAALRANDGLTPLRRAFEEAQKQTEYDTTYKQLPAKTQTPVMKSQWTGNDIVIGAPPLERVSNVPEGVTAFMGAESHYLKASQFASAGELDKAIPEYQMAIAADQSYADAIADYGAALALKGNWQDASVQYQKAIKLRPQDVLFRTNYARVLDELKQPEECIKQLEYAYTLNPKDAVVLKALASKALQSGDVGTAERMLKEALSLYPHSSVLYEKMAYAETVGGKLDDALVHANKAVSLDPASASAQLNLGSLLVAKGRLSDAISAYQQVLDKNPANGDALYLLGQAQYNAGNKSAAKAALEKFLSVCDKNDQRVEGTRKVLSGLNP